MRFAPVVLLAILMWVFIGLGFFGLYQQITKHSASRASVVQWVR